MHEYYLGLLQLYETADCQVNISPDFKVDIGFEREYFYATPFVARLRDRTAVVQLAPRLAIKLIDFRSPTDLAC